MRVTWRDTPTSLDPDATSHLKTLFIKSVQFDVTEDELRSVFEPLGATGVKLVTDHDTRRSKGVGFLDFDDHQVAEQVLTRISRGEFVLRGHAVTAEWARPRGMCVPSHETAVRNIPP